jgi:protoporphyrin/coproporphyrin ferrochelatase
LVIDSNPVARFLLVNLIIVPFRASKSAKLYQHIWSGGGSPLIMHSLKQKELLQKSLGDGYVVEVGMRYQNPSIEFAFKKLLDLQVESIVAIPLYPHWASSSTESSLMEIKRIAKKTQFVNIKTIEKFYDNADYLNALTDVATKYIPTSHDKESYDYFVFSYHGLPERQITKIYPDHCEINDACCSVITKENRFCYRAACYYTTQQLVKRLSIPEGKYISSFQSRLDDKWLKPYSDKVIEQLAKEGKKKILVFSPAFVSDCLETLYEIGTEYEHIFKQHGGEKLQLVESLNENPKWIETLKNLAVGFPNEM